MDGSLLLEIDGVMNILFYREAFGVKMYFGIGVDGSISSFIQCHDLCQTW